MPALALLDSSRDGDAVCGGEVGDAVAGGEGLVFLPFGGVVDCID